MEVVEFEGPQSVRAVIDAMRDIVELEKAGKLSRLRIAFDPMDNSIKFKCNEWTWSRPFNTEYVEVRTIPE